MCYYRSLKKEKLLGATIQQVRKAKSLTQEELGKRVGLPKSSISKTHSKKMTFATPLNPIRTT